MRRNNVKVLPMGILTWAFVIGSSLLLPAQDNPYPQSDYRGRVVRLSLVEGDVSLQHGPNERWLDATINAPLLRGDRIWVGQGRTEIEFDDGSFVRLASGAVLEIQDLDLSSNGRFTQVFLSQGLAYFNIRESYNDNFRVTTPALAADTYQAARFRLGVNGQNELTVFHGEARVHSRAGTVTVRRNELFTLSSEDSDRYYLGSAHGRDDWDRWNFDRDDYLVRATSHRYLPANVSYGAYDLDRYGHWAYQSGYGYVWAPYGVATDWVPFGYGRWAYYPLFGYSWISYEPWGWLPYHYGRWAWIPGFGWGWVPGTTFAYWSPGTVFFFHHGGYVGWVPISPFDPYSTGTFISLNVFRPRNFFIHRTVIVNHNTFINHVVRQETIVRNREVLTQISSNGNLSFASQPRLERSQNSEVLRPNSFVSTAETRLPTDTKGWNREGLRGTGARPSESLARGQSFESPANRNTTNGAIRREGLRGSEGSDSGNRESGLRRGASVSAPNSNAAGRSEGSFRNYAEGSSRDNRTGSGRSEGENRESILGSGQRTPYSYGRDADQGRSENRYSTSSYSAPALPPSAGSRSEGLRPQSPSYTSPPRSESYRAPSGEALRQSSTPPSSPPNEARPTPPPSREQRNESRPNNERAPAPRGEGRPPADRSSYFAPREEVRPSYSRERPSYSYTAPQSYRSAPSYTPPAPRYEALQRPAQRSEAPSYAAPRYEAPRPVYSPPAMSRQEFSRPSFSHSAPAPSFRNAPSPPAPRSESRSSGGRSEGARDGRRR